MGTWERFDRLTHFCPACGEERLCRSDDAPCPHCGWGVALGEDEQDEDFIFGTIGE